MPKPLIVQHYPRWSAQLERVLLDLPEIPTCPHELFAEVAANDCGIKRFAVVLDQGEPVALAALRRVRRHWAPMTTGIAPNAVMPCREGYLYPALQSLGRDIWVRYVDDPPPPGVATKIESMTTYAATPDVDIEHYWHETGLWGMVKWARKVASRFTFSVDLPGAAPYCIERWRDRWENELSTQVRVASDLILAAGFFERARRYHAFQLMDGDTPIAGHDFYIDGARIISQITWHDSAYRKYSPGTRLNDQIVSWAFEHGYAEVDFGGGHDYKAQWAPPAGHMYDYNICPPVRHALKETKHRATYLARQVRSRFVAHSTARAHE